MDRAGRHAHRKLRPSEATAGRPAVHRVDDAADAGVGANTAKGEKSACKKFYVPYCQRLKTSIWCGLEALRHPLRAAYAACCPGDACSIIRKNVRFGHACIIRALCACLPS